jgi:hypothetical protein
MLARGKHMTQNRSTKRCKIDMIGDKGIQDIFNSYQSLNLIEFREACITAIESSSGKKETKETFKRALGISRSKDQMLQKVTNYFLAGQGFGV